MSNARMYSNFSGSKKNILCQIISNPLIPLTLPCTGVGGFDIDRCIIPYWLHMTTEGITAFPLIRDIQLKVGCSVCVLLTEVLF